MPTPADVSASETDVVRRPDCPPTQPDWRPSCRCVTRTPVPSARPQQVRAPPVIATGEGSLGLRLVTRTTIPTVEVTSTPRSPRAGPSIGQVGLTLVDPGNA